MIDVRSTHTTVPFDFYRDIHKAICVALFDAVTEAGRLDPCDYTARIAHATQVHDLVKFLVQHAEHEDIHMDAAIQQVLPDQAAAIAAEHVALEERMADLIDLADLAYQADRDDARAAVHDLYLDLASFTSAYLAHQEVEERAVMPALWNAFGSSRSSRSTRPSWAASPRRHGQEPVEDAAGDEHRRPQRGARRHARRRTRPSLCRRLCAGPAGAEGVRLRGTQRPPAAGPVADTDRVTADGRQVTKCSIQANIS